MDRDGRQAQIYAWAKQAFTTEQATSLPQSFRHGATYLSTRTCR